MEALKNTRTKLSRPFVVWLMGLSGAGKTTLASELRLKLQQYGIQCGSLDGDVLRSTLTSNLDFSDQDRTENIKLAARLAKIKVDYGMPVIAAFMSPKEHHREIVRSTFESHEVIEVYVDTSLKECERRDSKGLYQKARQGLIKDVVGIDATFEHPVAPTIHIKTEKMSVSNSVSCILDYLIVNDFMVLNDVAS